MFNFWGYGGPSTDLFAEASVENNQSFLDSLRRQREERERRQAMQFAPPDRDPERPWSTPTLGLSTDAFKMAAGEKPRSENPDGGGIKGWWSGKSDDEKAGFAQAAGRLGGILLANAGSDPWGGLTKALGAAPEVIHGSLQEQRDRSIREREMERDRAWQDEQRAEAKKGWGRDDERWKTEKLGLGLKSDELDDAAKERRITQLAYGQLSDMSEQERSNALSGMGIPKELHGAAMRSPTALKAQRDAAEALTFDVHGTYSKGMSSGRASRETMLENSRLGVEPTPKELFDYRKSQDKISNANERTRLDIARGEADRRSWGGGGGGDDFTLAQLMDTDEEGRALIESFVPGYAGLPKERQAIELQRVRRLGSQGAPIYHGIRERIRATMGDPDASTAAEVVMQYFDRELSRGIPVYSTDQAIAAMIADPETGKAMKDFGLQLLAEKKGPAPGGPAARIMADPAAASVASAMGASAGNKKPQTVYDPGLMAKSAGMSIEEVRVKAIEEEAAGIMNGPWAGVLRGRLAVQGSRVNPFNPFEINAMSTLR